MTTRTMPPGALNLDKEYYTISYKCTNCGKTILLEFIKGETAPRCPDVPCKICGCKTLVKKI